MNTKSKISEFFGQFAERSFYADLAKTVVAEVIRAAVLALTGSITYYISNKVSGRQLPQQGVVPATSDLDLSRRAFGGGEYGRNPSYPINGPSTFPGFVNR